MERGIRHDLIFLWIFQMKASTNGGDKKTGAQNAPVHDDFQRTLSKGDRNVGWKSVHFCLCATAYGMRSLPHRHFN